MTPHWGNPEDSAWNKETRQMLKLNHRVPIPPRGWETTGKMTIWTYILIGSLNFLPNKVCLSHAQQAKTLRHGSLQQRQDLFIRQPSEEMGKQISNPPPCRQRAEVFMEQLIMKQVDLGSGSMGKGDREKVWQDFPGSPAAKTVLLMQGAQVWSLTRQLDPMCLN